MTDAERTEITGRSLLLFDGVCGLCNRVVHWLMRQDHEATLRFAPLESDLAGEVLARFPEGRPAGGLGQDGVILIVAVGTTEEQLFHRSDAVRETLRVIGRGGSALGWLLRLTPRLLRELGYTFVATSRYRIFGKHDLCPMPTAEERARILGL